MNTKFNVLVIGGGIVGLSAALAMAQRGYSVAVIDAGSLKTDLSSSDNRVYAINHASQKLLEQLGAWQHLEQRHLSAYSRMHVWDALNGAYIDFDSRIIAEQNLGTIIEGTILKQALLQEVSSQPSICLFPDTSIEDVYSQKQYIEVGNSQQFWEGQLLMVADGANSPIRQKLKVPLHSRSYDQHALVATVAVEHSHQRTAYQVFNCDGPLAFLPLADAHQCSIVWSTNPSQVKHLMSVSKEEFNCSVTEAFAKKLGQVQLISARHQFPLHMRHVKQYTGDRWLLLGDAAHSIHPLAGLGLNLGLADVSSWINCMDLLQGNLWSKKVLGAYQRERKYAVWQIIILMQGFKSLFSYSFAPIVSFRGLALSFCNELRPIKRLFINHAQGNL